MIDVVLDWHEVAMASHVGWLRACKSKADGRADARGFVGPGWDQHIEGACGELAVAKALGRYWSGSVDAFDACDLPGLQVKTTAHANARLLIAPDADDGHRYVLVTGMAPRYRVCGWILAREAKRPDWLLDPSGKGRPAVFCVPQDALHPMDL